MRVFPSRVAEDGKFPLGSEFVCAVLWLANNARVDESIASQLGRDRKQPLECMRQGAVELTSFFLEVGRRQP